jgi:hypothetical protein
MIEKDLLLKMNIQELLKEYPFVIKVFEKFELKCNSCMFSKNVSLEEALQSSGLPSKEIIEEIIRYLGGEDEGLCTCIHG